MKHILCLIVLVTASHLAANCQLYSTRTGFVGFYSKTALEDIKAENNQVYAVLDGSKKNLAFALLLKGFVFTKELMQEHFNENYVESDKDGIYKVVVKGNLNLHNVTRPIEIPATMEVKNGRIVGTAEFRVKPEDFNISIPSIVREKIDKEMTVRVKIDCGTK